MELDAEVQFQRHHYRHHHNTVRWRGTPVGSRVRAGWHLWNYHIRFMRLQIEVTLLSSLEHPAHVMITTKSSLQLSTATSIPRVTPWTNIVCFLAIQSPISLLFQRYDWFPDRAQLGCQRQVSQYTAPRRTTAPTLVDMCHLPRLNLTSFLKIL